MPRFLELRRHADNEGDVLSPSGIAAAIALGRELSQDYAAVWTSGAQRATQTAGCLLAGLGKPVPGGVIVEYGLRSGREDEWRAAYRAAGAGDLETLRGVAPELVERDSNKLAVALRSIIEQLSEDERGLAIGHSPTNEASVYGLTGCIVAPLGKCQGVLVVESSGEYTVTSLD